VVHEPVTFVNAPLIAKERGISVEESKASESQDYVNLIEVHATSKEETVTVAGTLVGKRDDERLVRVYGYEIDMAFNPIMVFFRYVDRPGVIGAVGTALGEAGINIANMQVGRTDKGGEALMGLTVDSPIPEDLLEAVVKDTQMRDAHLIMLDGDGPGA
jgi:D-3-phosphoglycerate dehydrogenase / 2-oxoglutarate reductase